MDKNYEFRVLNYLGSKFRVVDQIRDAVSAVSPPGSTVCDLFAGAGSVSYALSTDRNVIASDIQEYSRTICSSLLSDCRQTDAAVDLAQKAKKGAVAKTLAKAYSSLLDAECNAIDRAKNGDVNGLCEIFDVGGTQGALDRKTGRPSVMRSEFKRCSSAIESELPRHDVVMTTYYGGLYFGVKQSVDFDSLLYEIHRLPQGIQRDHLLTAAMAAASELVNSIGKQFAQPVRLRDSEGRPKLALASKVAKERSLDVYSVFIDQYARIAKLKRHHGRHRSICQDYQRALSDKSIEFDVIYADPPYTREHYSRFYHVLETMVKHDDPSASLTSIRSTHGPRVSRGVYRMDRHQSPFCIISQAHSAFDCLFHGAARRRVPLILSYSPFNEGQNSRPRLMTIDGLIELAKRHFKRVACVPVKGISHNKFNKAERNLTVEHHAEVLISCS